MVAGTCVGTLIAVHVHVLTINNRAGTVPTVVAVVWVVWSAFRVADLHSHCAPPSHECSHSRGGNCCSGTAVRWGGEYCEEHGASRGVPSVSG